MNVRFTILETIVGGVISVAFWQWVGEGAAQGWVGSLIIFAGVGVAIAVAARTKRPAE